MGEAFGFQVRVFRFEGFGLSPRFADLLVACCDIGTD